MNRLAKEGHIVEEINDVRCAIVEKNASPERVEFLKELLEYNGYTVMTAPTPSLPVKKPIISSNSPEWGGSVSAPVSPSGGEGGIPHSAFSTFTVGVTNISFHPMLAVYEQSLFRTDGKPISIAYWNQEQEQEEELYWERRIR